MRKLNRKRRKYIEIKLHMLSTNLWCNGCYAAIWNDDKYIRIGEIILCDGCFNNVRYFIINELIEDGDLPDDFMENKS